MTLWETFILFTKPKKYLKLLMLLILLMWVSQFKELRVLLMIPAILVFTRFSVILISSFAKSMFSFVFCLSLRGDILEHVHCEAVIFVYKSPRSRDWCTVPNNRVWRGRSRVAFSPKSFVILLSHIFPCWLPIKRRIYVKELKRTDFWEWLHQSHPFMK